MPSIVSSPKQYETCSSPCGRSARLERARDQGWYRVRPGAAVDRLGDLTRFRTLAFYQPDSFKDDARRVRYHAPVVAYDRRPAPSCCPKSGTRPR